MKGGIHMGSFSWMCCCGCGREITPTYTKVLEECSGCGDTTLDGQEVVDSFNYSLD